MGDYHGARASTRPFLVTGYVSDAAGRMIPERPTACPFAPASAAACSIVVEHWRPRKTGPKHAVLVVACRDHRRAFTLYPCGHVPYGRVAIAPVREDGSPLSGEGCWRTTVFEAAIDARSDILWPRADEEDHKNAERRRPLPDGEATLREHRRTQGRRLAQSEILIGLDDALSASAQSLVAARIGLSTLELRDGQRALESYSRTRERGEVVADLLDRISVQPSLLDAILIAGALAGEWGPPIRWESRRQRRRFLLPPGGAPP